MIRLTEKERNPDGTAVSKKSLIDRKGKGYPSSYATAIVTKLAEFEDLEELIGVPLKYFAKILNDHVPEECKYPKKAIILTDNDVDKWRVYKNADKQGLLLQLPCKVKDTVYVIVCKDISKQSIKRITINSTGMLEFCTKKRGFQLSDIGKTVFLTQAEAEQKLKELRGEQNDGE